MPVTGPGHPRVMSQSRLNMAVPGQISVGVLRQTGAWLGHGLMLLDPYRAQDASTKLDSDAEYRPIGASILAHDSGLVE